MKKKKLKLERSTKEVSILVTKDVSQIVAVSQRRKCLGYLVYCPRVVEYPHPFKEKFHKGFSCGEFRSMGR
jgi:hypothetical protein